MLYFENISNYVGYYYSYELLELHFYISMKTVLSLKIMVKKCYGSLEAPK